MGASCLNFVANHPPTRPFYDAYYGHSEENDIFETIVADEDEDMEVDHEGSVNENANENDDDDDEAENQITMAEVARRVRNKEYVRTFSF